MRLIAAQPEAGHDRAMCRWNAYFGQPVMLDELRLWFHPLIVGAGSPSDLLFGTVPATGFDLTDTTTLSNGIVILSYQTGKTLERAA